MKSIWKFEKQNVLFLKRRKKGVFNLTMFSYIFSHDASDGPSWMGLYHGKVEAYFQTLDVDVTEGAALVNMLDDGDGEVWLMEVFQEMARCEMTIFGIGGLYGCFDFLYRWIVFDYFFFIYKQTLKNIARPYFMFFSLKVWC